MAQVSSTEASKVELAQLIVGLNEQSVMRLAGRFSGSGVELPLARWSDAVNFPVTRLRDR